MAITVYIHEDFNGAPATIPDSLTWNRIIAQCDEREVESIDEAEALLLAYAAKSDPELAVYLADNGAVLKTNKDYRRAHQDGLNEQALPAELREEVIREVAAMEREEVTYLVREALNDAHRALKHQRQGLNFVQDVTRAAREWAKHCWDLETDQHDNLDSLNTGNSGNHESSETPKP